MTRPPCGRVYSRARSPVRSDASLTQGTKVQDLRDEARQDLEGSVDVLAVLAATVVTVLVAALESLPEVVVVLRLVDVQAAVTVVGVLVGPRVAVAEAPAVLLVGLAGAIAFLVAVVHRLLQQVRAVLARVVGTPIVGVPIDRGRVEIGVAVVVVGLVAERLLPLLAQPVVVPLQERVLGPAVLPLDRCGLLLREAFAVLLPPRLLLRDELLLPGLREPPLVPAWRDGLRDRRRLHARWRRRLGLLALLRDRKSVV